MATAQTQIRIDTNIKKEAVSLFSSLGLDMSSAVNLFLHQCILHGGLPFAVELRTILKSSATLQQLMKRHY